MIRRPPRSTRTDTLFPYTTLFRSHVTVEAVKGCVRRTARALTDDFGIAHPRIVVAGLNPHAGEGGTIGREEVEIIAPAIAALRSEGSRVGKASVSKSRSRWAPVN